jgi:hypothetical protein
LSVIHSTYSQEDFLLAGLVVFGALYLPWLVWHWVRFQGDLKRHRHEEALACAFVLGARRHYDDLVPAERKRLNWILLSLVNLVWPVIGPFVMATQLISHYVWEREKGVSRVLDPGGAADAKSREAATPDTSGAG